MHMTYENFSCVVFRTKVRGQQNDYNRCSSQLYLINKGGGEERICPLTSIASKHKPLCLPFTPAGSGPVARGPSHCTLGTSPDSGALGLSNALFLFFKSTGIRSLYSQRTV